MLYNIDANGVKTLKDPKQLDFTKDYVSEAMNDHPELIAQGDVGAREFFKTSPSSDLGATNKYEVKGVTHLKKHYLKIPIALMEEVRDKAGNVTGPRVRKEQLPGIRSRRLTHGAHHGRCLRSIRELPWQHSFHQ
jgi:hypothetical protein